MPQISVTFFQNFISLKNRMMLLLAAIDVGGSLPALPALYHVEKQNGTILPYFLAILSKNEESIRRPLYLGCQQVPDALRAGRGAFRIWAVMPGEKQPRRRIAKHGRSVFCVLIVYSKAADFDGVGAALKHRVYLLHLRHQRCA